MDKFKRTLGVTKEAKGVLFFKVWAPFADEVKLEIIKKDTRYLLPMQKDDEGYFFLKTTLAKVGDNYLYHLPQGAFPDPASDFQPQGANHASEIVALPPMISTLAIPLEKYIIYELHIGTYSQQGNFESLIPFLDELQQLGITAIEIMPIAQFSGARNWGYDGVLPFAVQNTYGDPYSLHFLVNECHKRGLAVILDVVYNHLGPEYNYFNYFGPYFTEKYQTPWGKAINFDDAHNHHVRRFFIENALHWFTQYGIDALRLDALHAIVDHSAYPFIEELADAVHALSKHLKHDFYLIAESSANDPRLLREKNLGGFNLHAQWNDEFHHAVHAILTQEHTQYYQDFGKINHVEKAFSEGYVYSGEYSAFRQRPHGVTSADIPAKKFVVFMQNHDHVGNRPFGDRLTHNLNTNQLRLFAAMVIFSPYIPLLFMGEEYGETAPFQYFISHENKTLIEQVRKGRRQEFKFNTAATNIPDPQAETTFLNSKLNHLLKEKPWHASLWNYYKKAINLRKTNPVLSFLCKEKMTVKIENNLLVIHREHASNAIKIIINLFNTPRNFSIKKNDHLIWNTNTEEVPENIILPFTLLLFERKCND